MHPLLSLKGRKVTVILIYIENSILNYEYFALEHLS